MMWWNNKEVNDLKEKRVDNRRELDDIRDTVHDIRGDMKDLADSKQNKIHFSWFFGILLYLISSATTSIWWASGMDANSKNTIVQLQQINDNLKDATKSRFTAKEAMTQFSIRDDAIVRLTTSIETQSEIQTDMNSRLDGLEQTLSGLYREHTKK